MLGIIIVMLWIAKPATYFSTRELSAEAKYIVQALELNEQICEYRREYGYLPASLSHISHIGQDSLNMLFEYIIGNDSYTLRTKIPINDTFLIITGDSIQKYPHDE